MNSAERLATLISSGYFPRELPSTFTTKDFGLHCSDILPEWESNKIFQKRDVKGKSKNYYYTVPDTEPEILSKPKTTFERRSIHITHPIPQALLSYEISNNWKSVHKWLSRKSYSLDKIEISKTFSRAIKDIDFRLHQIKKDFIESTSDWLVITDITRFYPTVYTHSITWAAYGKEKVKKDLRKFHGSTADRLDQLVRKCNRNQTIGIPIGPETSRIIADIISSRIECDFQVSLKICPTHADRLQDDWFIGADSLEQAETILARIITSYREYGLEINGSKTSINHITSSRKQAWRAELAAYLGNVRGRLGGGNLSGFFNLSLKLQSENPDAPIVSYVLSVIEGRGFPTSDISTVESFLLKASVIAPISLNRICHALVNLEHFTSRLSKKRIHDRYKTLIERHLENGNSYEAMWMIYTLRGLKISLHSKILANLMETHSGSVIPLILLDMKDKGLFQSNLPTALWENKINKGQVESSWIWLLAYEGIMKNWLQDRTGVMGRPFFSSMSNRNIQFYDPSRNVPDSRAARLRRRASTAASTKSARRLLLLLRLGGPILDYD